MVWADTNYLHKKKITIDHTKVTSNEVNFPIVLVRTDADLTGCQANGYDIKFYDSTETVQLKHGIEEWDNSTGYLIVWIKIPSLSSVVDTEIYMYYEYPGEGSNQADHQNVWDSNHEFVSHCNDTDTKLNDRTANNNDFDGVDGLNAPFYSIIYRDDGKIGKGVGFTNPMGYGLDGAVAYFMNNTMDMTTWTASSFEIWYRPDAISGPKSGGLFCSKYDNSDDLRFLYYANNPASGESIDFDDGTNWLLLNRDNNDNTSTFYHTAFACTNAGIGSNRLFRNGTLQTSSDTNTFNYAGLDNKHRIGIRLLNDLLAAFGGTFDEIRLSSIQRSDSWIETGYTNQDNPAAFASFDAEESITPTFKFKHPVKGKVEKRWKYSGRTDHRFKYTKKDGVKYKYNAKK